ncbi:hypothetical protein D3C80_1862530 [compost metagenome]
MQFRPPFTIKHQHAKDRGKRQHRVKARRMSGDFTHIHNVMLFIGLLVEVTLPKEMRNRHADNRRNRDG